MGNCLSSEKPLSDPGNRVQSKRHNENLSNNQVDLNRTQNSGSESNSPDTKVGSLQQSSPGSTASPQDGSIEIKGDDMIKNNDLRSGNGINSVQTIGGPNGNAGSNNLSAALPSQDSKGRQEVKILLLGSGESGKSTILKQMKILHQNGYSQEDLLMYKTTIYKNLLDCAKSIVAALEQFNLSITDRKTDPEDGKFFPETLTDIVISKDADATGVTNEELEFIKSSIISPDPDTLFDPKLASIIARLWSLPTVKRLFKEQRAQFYIMDSAPYFFNNVDRIGGNDYIPNVADILRARIKTTGIYDTKFEMGKLNIHMFDVGGQRSERRKWINCFDNVTLIIFCVALSEYDQVLLEETSQNRMAESLVLFESIINSRWFARTSVVLFLNKIDVFTEKLPFSPLENYFPDYAGGNDIKNAAKYILWRFNKLNRNNVNIYPHLTQATDTSNIRLVFAAVKETILQNSLRDSGIL